MSQVAVALYSADVSRSEQVLEVGDSVVLWQSVYAWLLVQSLEAMMIRHKPRTNQVRRG